MMRKIVKELDVDKITLDEKLLDEKIVLFDNGTNLYLIAKLKEYNDDARSLLYFVILTSRPIEMFKCRDNTLTGIFKYFNSSIDEFYCFDTMLEVGEFVNKWSPR